MSAKSLVTKITSLAGYQWQPRVYWVRLPLCQIAEATKRLVTKISFLAGWSGQPWVLWLKFPCQQVTGYSQKVSDWNYLAGRLQGQQRVWWLKSLCRQVTGGSQEFGDWDYLPSKFEGKAKCLLFEITSLAVQKDSQVHWAWHQLTAKTAQRKLMETREWITGWHVYLEIEPVVYVLSVFLTCQPGCWLQCWDPNLAICHCLCSSGTTFTQYCRRHLFDNDCLPIQL